MSISVVIPVYNRGEAIAATLDSVLSQTWAPVEILVVDDGSTDGSANWIEAHYGDHVRVIRQPNGGVARARNRGWREAQGEWIAFLDHDDQFRADKLEVLNSFIESEADVVVSRWREMQDGEIVRVSPVVRPRNAFGWLFGWSNPIVSMSVPLVRRAALERVGGFDPRTAPADDWDLWLRLARTTIFSFCDEVTTLYALHENQQRRDEARMFRAVRGTLAKYPLELARRPLLLWWLVWSGAFRVSIPAYKSFARGERGGLRMALRAHPLALLAPQWVALLLKRLTGRILKP
ncbi:chondroitin synthase [Abditibacteriota bacterium]|nr:chondroitin synthase [Abditibacteriota bacterium]